MSQQCGGVNPLRSLECGACFQNYNETDRAPLCLQCGHTWCKDCLTKQPKTQCPKCATVYGAIADLKKNFTVIELLGLLSDRDGLRSDSRGGGAAKAKDDASRAIERERLLQREKLVQN